MSDSRETSDCGCHADEKRAASDPAYRRALWIVVLLNLGFGSITLVGLFALAWAEQTRTRVALTQGCFLAALGLGVIGAAIWRSINAIAPEAALMGGLGVAGLIVNISAAIVLMRFR